MKGTYILKRIDRVTSLLNFSSNNLRNQLLDKVLQCPTRSLLTHNIRHPFPDLTNLRALSIRRLLNLIRSTFRKRNDKNSQKVAIRRLDICVGFNEGLPFTNEGFEFVAGEGHAGEIG